MATVNALRIAFLACSLLVEGVLLDACKRRAPPGAAVKQTAAAVVNLPLRAPGKAMLPAQEITWDYPSTGVGPMRVVILVPEREPNQRFPVLVAMHGRGEALKGPEQGARGWVDDYWLPLAIERLARPPITSDDLRGFVDEQRLAALNDSLKREPYRGLIVVCPYTPDILPADESLARAMPLTRFVVDTLLPRVYRETPAIGSAATTGIDGVSLGGRAALAIGFARPSAFAVVASLQAALRADNADDVVRRGRAAKTENPNLRVRLLTSSDDYFLKANQVTSEGLASVGVPNELVTVPGPHDYDFNRGPGAYEMLLFHDRALRGLPTF